MRKFIGLLAIIALGAVLWAETDYQVGQGVERVITRRLQVQGNNARAIFQGAPVEVTNATVTIHSNLIVNGSFSVDDLTVDDDLAVVDLSVSGTADFAGTRTEVDSSAGYFRVGYPADLGWQLNTIGGGATLQFQSDFARTGMVTRVSITTNVVTVPNVRGTLIPTSSNGLAAGTFWNSNGYVCVTM